MSYFSNITWRLSLLHSIASVSLSKISWLYLYLVCTELIDKVGKNWHFDIIESSYPCTCNSSLFISFFLIYQFYSSPYTDITCNFLRLLSKSSIFGGFYVNGIVNLIWSISCSLLIYRKKLIFLNFYVIFPFQYYVKKSTY